MRVWREEAADNLGRSILERALAQCSATLGVEGQHQGQWAGSEEEQVRSARCEDRVMPTLTHHARCQSGWGDQLCYQ